MDFENASAISMSLQVEIYAALKVLISIIPHYLASQSLHDI